MFSTTFLGHQGWLFATERTRVLVDPLLTETFGHGGVVGEVYPPRHIHLEGFPPIDAVLITHEHEDHFDVPTLNRLDRRIPILLSAGSSSAAGTLLETMGFTVHRVRGGQTLTVGDLEILLVTPDHVASANLDEWEVVQFAIRDRQRDGNFITGVDCDMTAASLAELQALLGAPGLWCQTNNATAWSFQQGGDVIDDSASDSPLSHLAEVGREQRALRASWGAPAGTVFCGGGWSFSGDRAWLNHSVFPTESARLGDGLRAVFPRELFLAPHPGQTVHMTQGKVTGIEERTNFLSTPPPSDWPSREHTGGVELMDDYGPASGRTTFTVDDRDELLAALDDFAAFLYGGRLFAGLYSLDAITLGERRATFCLAVLAGPDREPHVLEYDPRGCRFVAAESDDPVADYAGGLECWGSDLLDLFRGRFGPTAIAFGRGRAWSHFPRQLPVNVFMLWSFFNPLRRPRQFLGLYRTLLAREPDAVAHVPAAAASHVEVCTRTGTRPI